MEDKDEIVNYIREFNRFYTANMGLLNANYLNSNYSIAETRVLFEINRFTACIQNDIVSVIGIDKSYLSRIIQNLYKKGLIDKSKTQNDKREVRIFLTDEGKAEVEKLIELINRQIQSQIKNLTGTECDMLHNALQTIISILGKGNYK